MLPIVVAAETDWKPFRAAAVLEDWKIRKQRASNGWTSRAGRGQGDDVDL
jgi:hypothetical protein